MRQILAFKWYDASVLEFTDIPLALAIIVHLVVIIALIVFFTIRVRFGGIYRQPESYQNNSRKGYFFNRLFIICAMIHNASAMCCFFVEYVATLIIVFLQYQMDITYFREVFYYFLHLIFVLYVIIGLVCVVVGIIVFFFERKMLLFILFWIASIAFFLVSIFYLGFAFKIWIDKDAKLWFTTRQIIEAVFFVILPLCVQAAGMIFSMFLLLYVYTASKTEYDSFRDSDVEAGP